MNEYINNTNEAHEEYKRSLNQLRETNLALKQQLAEVASELQQANNSKKQL